MHSLVEVIVSSLMCIVIGFTAGQITALNTASNELKKFMEPFDAAIAKCQQNLPRNQTCVLVYEAKVKQ